ncbi:uncharacterized protein [Arachis hypogaea]|uniref:uncharacterized protein n=1 Tax=Arachis hypogaea TaxID=3818 RepID=UPI003B20C843
MEGKESNGMVVYGDWVEGVVKVEGTPAVTVVPWRCLVAVRRSDCERGKRGKKKEKKKKEDRGWSAAVRGNGVAGDDGWWWFSEFAEEEKGTLEGRRNRISRTEIARKGNRRGASVVAACWARRRSARAVAALPELLAAAAGPGNRLSSLCLLVSPNPAPASLSVKFTFIVRVVAEVVCARLYGHRESLCRRPSCHQKDPPQPPLFLSSNQYCPFPVSIPILLFLNIAYSWLKLDIENVVVVHCKAGTNKVDDF